MCYKITAYHHRMLRDTHFRHRVLVDLAITSVSANYHQAHLGLCVLALSESTRCRQHRDHRLDSRHLRRQPRHGPFQRKHNPIQPISRQLKMETAEARYPPHDANVAP